MGLNDDLKMAELPKDRAFGTARPFYFYVEYKGVFNILNGKKMRIGIDTNLLINDFSTGREL